MCTSYNSTRALNNCVIITTNVLHLVPLHVLDVVHGQNCVSQPAGTSSRYPATTGTAHSLVRHLGTVTTETLPNAVLKHYFRGVVESHEIANHRLVVADCTV